jgi:hypothetical protein
MSQSSPDALGVSRKVLRILIKLNWLMGFLILALLVASLVAPGPVMRGLGVDPMDANAPLIGMRLIMVIGIVSVPITHTVLARLLAIVDTVLVRNPFVVENAVRLRKIAWAVLSLEVLHFVVVAVAANASTPQTPLDIGSDFSVTRWLAVLLLFVLAHVFEHGSRMREDLEGTV